MKVGFICGAFDLLHAGHIHLLKECKKNCDYLVVGIHLNPQIERPEKNKPIETVLDRQIKLLGTRYVDNVIVYELEQELDAIKKFFNINVRFLGSDYKLDASKPITDMDIPIIYIDSIDIHTSQLRKFIKEQ